MTKYNRHAYCIIAHNEPDVFLRLVHALDFPENDIFVHVDKSIDITPFKEINCHFSRISFTPLRLRCSWGTPNMIRVELMLLEQAMQFHSYSYFHILSGVDYPLKTQHYIHSFLDTSLMQYNFIGFDSTPNIQETIDYRTSTYHLLTRRPGGSILDKILSRLNRLSNSIQRIIGIRRVYPYKLYKGAVWASISNDFCNYLIRNKNDIMSTFKYTRCTDEVFLQSTFMASPYSYTLFKPEGDEYDQCLREIDWTRGSPYTWKETDFEYLISSNRWFARKFSSEHMELIDHIAKHLTEKNDS